MSKKHGNYIVNSLALSRKDNVVLNYYGRKPDKKKQRENRKRLQDRMKAERDAKLKELRDFNKKYPCSFCRDFVGNYDYIKHGCDEQYGFVIKKDEVFCPKCKKLIVRWED
jgi:hypothetical protein